MAVRRTIVLALLALGISASGTLAQVPPLTGAAA